MVSRRVLYIIDSLKIGGAEMLLLGLLDSVAEAGGEAHVAYFTPGPLEPEVRKRGVPLTRLSEKGLKDPRVILRVRRLIRDWQPDVVHTHLVKSDLAGQVAARMTGTPRIITLHNTDPWRTKPLMSAAYRAATAGADACIAVSERVADHVGRTKGFARNRIATIVNGIDLEHFTPSQPPLDLTRFGVPEGAPVCAVIGSLTPQKDHANFVAAADIVAQADPRPYFLIVGDGPLKGDIAAAIAKTAASRDRIIMTGEIKDMAQLLSAIDLQVISSAWEGLPMTLLEGMAMEKPVVTTAVGGIPDVVEDGRNGRLVAPKSAKALAAAMAEVLGDVDKARQLGLAARKTIAATYGRDVMRDKLFAIYDRVAKPASKSPGRNGRAISTL